MEIQLNKNLEKVQENVFMGLNPRQALWAGVGVVAAIGVFWVCYKKGMNTELATWLCMAAVVPAGAMGFVTYQGLPFERLCLLWIRNYLLMPQKLIYRLENRHYAKDKARIEQAEELEAKIIE